MYLIYIIRIHKKCFIFLLSVIYLIIYATMYFTNNSKNTAFPSHSSFWKSNITKLSCTYQIWTFYKCPFLYFVAISFLCLFSVKLFNIIFKKISIVDCSVSMVLRKSNYHFMKFFISN